MNPVSQSDPTNMNNAPVSLENHPDDDVSKMIRSVGKDAVKTGLTPDDDYDAASKFKEASAKETANAKKLGTFSYVAMDKNGNQVSGDIEAETANDVAGFLQQRGLVVVEVHEKIGFALKQLGNIQIGGVPLGEKVIFMKQLATMTSAGLPLVAALESLTSQIKNPNFRSNMEKVVQDVQGGSRLSGAFAKRSNLFSKIEVNLIKAGEESGNMVEMLKQLADNLEKTKDFQSKVQGALIYPAIIFIAVIAVVVMLMLFMIPSIKDIFTDFGADLPLTTKIMISLSDFTVNYWWALLILAVASVGGFLWYRSTPSGRLLTDKLILKLPIFGSLVAKIQVAEMSRLLAMLMRSGIPILSTLDIVSEALSNVHFSLALKTAAEKVEKGVPMAVPFAQNPIIPILMSRMIATGEETGNLEKVLQDVADYYQTEVDNITANLTKIMEPIILLVVGGIVGILALAVYGPIFQLAQVIG